MHDKLDITGQIKAKKMIGLKDFSNCTTYQYCKVLSNKMYLGKVLKSIKNVFGVKY